MPRTDHKPRKRLDPQTRRAAIIASAGLAFAAQPYEQVSVATVAADAGASEALVYRYFESKAGLYVETLRTALAATQDRQRQAAAALPRAAEVRDRVRAHLDAYLDAVSAGDDWAAKLLLPGNEPAEALAARAELRLEAVDHLREIVADASLDDYLLHGYLGFVDAGCARWVARGCPQDERPVLAEAALGALFGEAPGADGDGRGEQRRRTKFGNRR